MRKKVNLSTLEEILYRGEEYKSGETEVKLTRAGFFSVKKDGATKLYESVTDAWRSI